LQSANERRRKILAVISIRRHDIVENLAYEFCVSKKTVFRDVDILSLEHNPIYALPGRHGGIFMVEGCNEGKKYLEIDEKNLLVRLLDFVEPNDRVILLRIIRTFSLPDKHT